jgi:hypothetical protein
LRLARWVLVAMFLLGGLTFAPRPASASLLLPGIVYTWNEADGQDVTGNMIVYAWAQPTGQITQSDVVSFYFSVPDGNFYTADLVSSSFPLIISTADASPISGEITATSGLGTLTLDFNGNWNQIAGEDWVLQDPGSGTGNWTIQGASVATPEPSTAVVGASSVVAGLASGWIRSRRRRRRRIE